MKPVTAVAIQPHSLIWAGSVEVGRPSLLRSSLSQALDCRSLKRRPLGRLFHARVFFNATLEVYVHFS